MFLATGTLANHLAVRVQAQGDQRVAVQYDSHLYNDSGDCAQVLSNLNLVPLAHGRGTFTLAEIRTLDAGSWFVETDPFGQIAAGDVTVLFLADIPDQVRLLTLTGAPGSGKTRMALRLALQHADSFPGGTAYEAVCVQIGRAHV